MVLCFFMFLLAIRNVFLYDLHSSSCHGISVVLPCRVCVECIEHFCLIQVLYLIIAQWNFKLCMVYCSPPVLCHICYPIVF